MAVKTVFLFEVGVEGDRRGPPASGGDGESEWWLSLQEPAPSPPNPAAAATAAAIDELTVITDESGEEATLTDVVVSAVAAAEATAVAGEGGMMT